MKIFRKLIGAALIATCMTSMMSTQLMAESRAEVVGESKNFKGKVSFEDEEDAPVLRVVIKDAYKLQGKQEVFEIELQEAKWVEGVNTSLSISYAEGMNNYDGYIDPISNTKAKVYLNIPNNVEEGTEILVDIPLLIKVGKDVNKVVVDIDETDSREGLIDRQSVMVAASNEKKLMYEIKGRPDVWDGEAIAPIYFVETREGSLGSRFFEVILKLQNRYLSFVPPEYESKNEHADDVAYYVDVDKYLEYTDGFSRGDQRLRITLSNDGKTMTLFMQGSVPSSKGTIILKNICVKEDGQYVSDEDIKIIFQSDEITRNNEEHIVGYFRVKPKEEVKEEPTEEEKEQIEEREEKNEEVVKVPTVKKDIRFKMGEEQYTIDGVAYPMNGKTYARTGGYTMVPVRYVVEALGGNNIQFSDGKVKFTYDDKEVTLTTGSSEVIINNETKQMTIPLETVDGRVYAPMGEIANILGVEKSWNAVEKTACFSK